MKLRAWTAEQREAQAEVIRARAPWKRSTGPKSEKGKARVSQNSTKHGLRGGIFRRTEEFLTEQNKMLKELEK